MNVRDITKHCSLGGRGRRSWALEGGLQPLRTPELRGIANQGVLRG